MNQQELKDWIQKTFAQNQNSNDPLKEEISAKWSRVQKYTEQIEASGLLDSSFLVEVATPSKVAYELSQVNPSMALLFMQLLLQRKIKDFWKTQLQLNFDPASMQFFPSSLIVPLSTQKEIWSLSGNKILRHSLASAQALSYAPAFRDLPWAQLQRAESVVASMEDLRKYESFLNFSLEILAAMVAGIKKTSYLQAKAYSQQRVQGGRSIYNWSEVRMKLSDLFLSVEKDAALVPVMNPVLALEVLKGAEVFVSDAMQVFGGAGYIEDFGIEKSFREIHFLKSYWISLPKAQLQIYQAEVQVE